MKSPYLRKLVLVVIPVALILSTVMVRSGNATFVNFDSVDTSGGYVSGAPLVSYLAGYGITYTEGSNDLLMVANVAPYSWNNTSSNPNTLAFTGDRIASFRLSFEQPVNSLSFQRMGITSGAMAAWTATAYSASDVILGSASEGLRWGTSFSLIELGGSGIAYVDFVSDHLGVAGSHLQIDDLSFTPTPIPGALILFGSGLLGLVGISRKRMKK